uniref:Uncharacterized protein n=1 Tax=Lepeophtheirus salmonis TaxID=72036 RepID=A0A0K2VDU2_LEPSM
MTYLTEFRCQDKKILFGSIYYFNINYL